MAAAVVPSRARAARNIPPSSDVTYVRMNLIIDHLQGDLQPDPKHYFFRWIRGGKQVKVTAAKPANASPFAEKMALYASVRRHGPVFVSDNPSESLDTQLVLVMTEPGGQPTVVSTVAFDIAYYLDAIVEAGTKTLATTLQMPGSITLTVTLSVKAMGDVHLHRYVPERRLGLANAESTDMDEAAAAMELERLRQEVHETENRVGALEQSTDTLQDAVRRAHPATDPTGLNAARTRIRELEEKLVTSDQEKSEAQRRVQAHMAHAVKIRETYERLAVWYNDLRQEHSDLRKKFDGQPRDSSGSGDRSLATESNSREKDLQTLREERDKLQAELQQEQTEKSELHSRNSLLLETKARAFADLRDQWDAAQNTLVTMKQENEEKTNALNELRKTVDTLRSDLLERSATLEEKNAVLEDAFGQIQSMQASHSEAIENVKKETSEASRSLVVSETDELQRRHQAELEQLKGKLTTEMEASLQEVREQIRQEHEAEKSTEMARLAADHEKRIKEGEEKSQTALDSQLSALRTGYELQLAEKERVIKAITIRKDEADQEIVSLRNASSGATGRREGEERLRTSGLEEECTRLRVELEALRKENEEIRTSPRTISGAVDGSGTEQIAERLNGQIGELKTLLKAETEKRSETAKLLANADREHDELREMVTRLRSERDGALNELKQAKQAIPNPEIRHASVQRSRSRERRTDESSDVIRAEEERDKAIRELFRVRKNLNKEVRRLKQENQELAERPSSSTAPDSELSNAVALLAEERDSARSDLQHAQRELESANRSLTTERESSNTKSAQTDDLRKRLKSAEGDMVALRTTVTELQESLAISRKESADRVAQLTEERENVLRELNSSKSASMATEAALRDKEEKLAHLTNELHSATRGLTDANRGSEEMSRERDSARNRSAALATELETLKQSLNAMSSSSSSTETMLRDAQKEVAESKAEVKLLRSEIADLRNGVAAKEAQREKEASNFTSYMSQQRALLDTERVAKDKFVAKTTELEGLVATLNSKNETLSAKLTSEQNMKEDAEKRVVDAEKSLGRLREELSQVRANELTSAEAVGRATAEQEQTNRSLNDVTQRLQLLEQSLSQKNVEVAELQKKLGMAEAEADARRSESSKSSEDGKTIREELHAVRSELAQTQNELRQKSQQLDNEIAKSSEFSQQEAAAVRDLTGLSENLRSENSNLQSRLETTQDKVRTLRESYSKMESQLASVERDAVARDRAVSDYNNLKEAHVQLKEDMGHASQESARIRNEKSSLEAQVGSLHTAVDSLREQVVTIRNEKDEMLTAERASSERETARSNELRKELRSTRAVVESLQAEIEQLKAENEKLTKEKGEAGDHQHVLEDLIKKKVELAYAEEEAVRLRNKLKKYAPKGSGSASFEY